MRLTDTAGLDDGVDMQDSQGETRKRGPHIAASGIGRWPGHLLVAALAQTTRAVKESNLTLMVIDASAGVTPLDVQFARWLLKLGRPSLLLVNKSDRIDEQLPQVWWCRTSRTMATHTRPNPFEPGP
jgi:predicted GTPase